MDGLPPPSLDALLNPTVVEVRSAVPQMREQMIWEAACSLGARGGLVERSAQIKSLVDARAAQLDRLTFQPFMSPEGMLPPVVTEEVESVRQEGERDKRAAGVIYRMVREARFVTVAPTWRDYLFAGLVFNGKVEMPHKSFLPSNDEEKKVWQKAVKDCWGAGVAQADGIITENLARFEREYTGMVRYKYLVARGMAENPKLGAEVRPVSGNRYEIVVDDQRFRITGAGGLVNDAGRWK